MNGVATDSIMTTGDVARICGVTRRTVIDWIDSGKLEGFRIPGSRHRRVSSESLRRFQSLYKMPRHAAAPRRRLLIVDDDLDLLEFLTDALRNEFDIDVASSALEAASRLPVFRPDVILLDIRLPDLSGLEVCRHFRTDGGNHKIPILAMSAFERTVSADAARESGADGFLPKPLKLADVRRRIQSMVG